MECKINYNTYKTVLDELIDELKKEYGNELVSVVLYGSVARGEAQKHSDIDLLVVLESSSNIEKFLAAEKILKNKPSYNALHNAGFRLEFRPVIFSKKDAAVNRYIFLDIVEDGVILYDCNDFFKTRMKQLKKRLQELGSKRVFRKDGSWYWVLKPDLKFGEKFDL